MRVQARRQTCDSRQFNVSAGSGGSSQIIWPGRMFPIRLKFLNEIYFRHILHKIHFPLVSSTAASNIPKVNNFEASGWSMASLARPNKPNSTNGINIDSVKESGHHQMPKISTDQVHLRKRTAQRSFSVSQPSENTFIGRFILFNFY